MFTAASKKDQRERERREEISVLKNRLHVLTECCDRNITGIPVHWPCIYIYVYATERYIENGNIRGHTFQHERYRAARRRRRRFFVLFFCNQLREHLMTCSVERTQKPFRHTSH